MAGDDARVLEPILFSNRSASYASLNRYREALSDALTAVALRPDWAKGHSRVAVAQLGLGDLPAAFVAAVDGLRLDPASENLGRLVGDVVGKFVEESEDSLPEMLRRVFKDGVVGEFIWCDKFVGKMKDIQKDVSNVRKYLSDQRVIQALRVLLNADTPTKQFELEPITCSEERMLQLMEQLGLSGMHSRALMEKNVGNVAYGKNDFKTAIEHYTHGLKLVSMILTLQATNQNKGPVQTLNATSATKTMQTQSRATPISHHQDLNQVMTISEKETHINVNEIRVSSQGREQGYVNYAANLLQREDVSAIVFKGIGRAIGKTVIAVEQTKRRIAGLHQNTSIGSTDAINATDPLVKDLLSIHSARRVSTIMIILSKKELDICSVGYQPPLWTMPVIHQTDFGYQKGKDKKNVILKSKNALETKPYDDDDTDDACIILETNPFKEKVKTYGGDDSDDDCIILETNPFEEEAVSENIPSERGEDDELSIVAERGKVACRDYAHSRHLCANHPFEKTPHWEFCSQCYCYVCDTKAPCQHWTGDVDAHCHATEHGLKWKIMRSSTNALHFLPVQHGMDSSLPPWRFY